MTEKELINELEKLNYKITNNQLEKLRKYYELLITWNKKMNLTAIIDEEEVYLKHFYDSMTIIKIIDLNKYNNLCDIGTGAGFPGIVLKILYPKLKITLIDSLNKRICFLREVIKELDLENIEAIHCRAEEFSKDNSEKYDITIARAVAHLSTLLEYSIPMTKINGFFIAMKANIKNELIESKNAIKILNCELEKQEEFYLPKEKSNRVILKVRKNKTCPKKYPRKYNEIKKKRL